MRIQGSMYLEFFVQLEHVLLMVTPEDHIQVVVVLDILDPVQRCVFTLISVETKAWTIDSEESQY
jgi:hypothetical protein